MNRQDLLKKYSEETHNSIELLEKLLDFTKTNLEVLKYISWLEENKEPKEIGNADYIKDTAHNVVKFRFINEVKSRMKPLELLNYAAYDSLLQGIPPNEYAHFLSLFERYTIEEIKYMWVKKMKVNGLPN